MFIIELEYKVALEQIDACMKQHMAFLRKYYKTGNFIVSGRKVPRDGGIIVAQARNKKAIEKIIREDPFYSLKLADYHITEFLASQISDKIAPVIV